MGQEMTREFKGWIKSSMDKEAFFFALILTVLFLGLISLFNFLEVF